MPDMTAEYQYKAGDAYDQQDLALPAITRKQKDGRYLAYSPFTRDWAMGDTHREALANLRSGLESAAEAYCDQWCLRGPRGEA